MKAPKVLAASLASVAALCLAGGLAFALEPADPATRPMPEKAQDTSITKQVASIIIYEDQEEAVAMATEFDAVHDQLALQAVAERAQLARDHNRDDGAAAEDSPAENAAAENAAAAETAPEVAEEEAVDVEPVDVEHPLETISPEEVTEPDAMAAATINVNGDVMGYVPSYETASAPSSGAGLWMGSDSTTDGSWGYFIGHNPGSFTCVMTLKNGDPVTVCDSDGNARTYYVVDEFIVPDDTYWEDIQSHVTDYGESIILQTCCGDNAHYRVVIAN